MIKFPPRENGHDKNYDANLHALSADQSGLKFCPKFSHVNGVAFDVVAKDVMNWTGKTYSSVDAIVDVRADPRISSDKQAVYFIEFKNRRLEDLNTQGTKDAVDAKMRGCERIGVELRKKGVESVFISAATCFRKEPIDGVCDRAEFIIVYNDRKHVANESRYVKRFDEDFAKLAAQIDSFGIPIRWGLERLLQQGFYRSVHTWTIGEFENNMRNVLI